MKYRIKSSLLSAEKSYITGKPIEKPVQEMLAMYDRGDSLTDSPFIKAGQWMHHAYCFDKGNTIESAYERQQQVIDLYESIKENGYNGSKLYIWFDEEGFIHLGDGFHRIAILHYLNLDIEIDCETDWCDRYDGKFHKDFPLVEVLLKEAPQGKWTYQPVDDPRLAGWQIDRYDAKDRLSYILTRIKGKKVLDIGCSEGYYARELAKRGYDVTAIDRSAGLVAAARYLTTLANLKVNYHVVKDWSEFNGNYDTILFLAVIHNDMKTVGIEEGLRKLQLLRGRSNVLFMEVPNNHNERGWGKDPYPKYDFHSPEAQSAIESNLGMKVADIYKGRRVIYTMENGNKPDVVASWLTSYRKHYEPLFRTLAEKPCKNIMEIGVFDGTSAIAMIKEAAKLVPEKEITFYGFDLFEEMTPELRDEEFSFQGKLPPKMADVKAAMEKETSATIVLIKGNTRKTLPRAISTSGPSGPYGGWMPPMDLIYIDGGHTIETTRNDWQYSSQLMHEDTVVYFDDYCDEMPFIGSAFIVKELTKDYQFEVMPETDIYPRKFGRFKAQLLKVEKKMLVVVPVISSQPKSGHFRFHMLGLPHTKTTKEENICAFTQLVYRMGTMLTGLGHEVYHYGTEGSKLDCTEHIDVLTEAMQKESWGSHDHRKQLWVHKGSDKAYVEFCKNAVTEIKKRAQPKDMLLISNGSWMSSVSRSLPQMQSIEPIVGYIGFYSNYKVFPSYAWMHHMMGRRCEQRAVSKKVQAENFAVGSWYDAVIPHFFNPDDFTFKEKKDDYYLFIGRLITRKGPHVAADMVKRLGAKLIVTGQVLDPNNVKGCLNSLGLLHPNIEYIPPVSVEERNSLMANARAVIIPSLYFEPFGLVVVEALLCGTPVITTDWGSFPEIVQQGEVGYRCRTMDEFLWAARNVDKINPKRCRDYAVANYSMGRIAKAYQNYFTMVQDRYNGGWYTEHPERIDLDWLRRY